MTDKQQTLPGVDAAAPKLPRHTVIALRHLNKQRDKALERQAEVTAELESLDAAIEAIKR